MENELIEEWRPVVGFEGLYEVSDKGRVKSLARIVKGKIGTTKRLKGKILRPKISNRYQRVWLCRDGFKKIYGIHRLVAQAFIPNPQNKPQVNHIDANPANNFVSNLEWVTISENVAHAVKIGNKVGLRGEDSPSAKLTNLQRLEVRELYRSGHKQSKIAKAYGISQSAVSFIVNSVHPDRNY